MISVTQIKAARAMLGWSTQVLAEAAGVSKVSAPDWTWSAQDFMSHWMMWISFVACRLTALAVLHGVRSSMKAHESSN